MKGTSRTNPGPLVPRNFPRLKTTALSYCLRIFTLEAIKTTPTITAMGMMYKDRNSITSFLRQRSPRPVVGQEGDLQGRLELLVCGMRAFKSEALNYVETSIPTDPGSDPAPEPRRRRSRFHADSNRCDAETINPSLPAITSRIERTGPPSADQLLG
jgi:hypothetical protein